MYVGGHTNVLALSQFFRRIDYNLERVREGSATVPRLSIARLPADLHRIADVDRRKAAFVATVLPMVLQVNEAIHDERRRLRAAVRCLRQAGGLAGPERAWLDALHEKYATDKDIGLLLLRVDTVPPSLVLAQAVIESGWGRSRFALEGNALFGERTYGAGNGLVPRGLGEDASFLVRAFESLFHSVEAYAHNLNTSPAYAEFRQARMRLRRAGEPLAGRGLVPFLQAYSERGAAYVSDLRSIIATNGLEAFDRAELRPAGRHVFTPVQIPMCEMPCA